MSDSGPHRLPTTPARLLLLALLGFVSAGWGLQQLGAAEGEWWIEIVRERPLPTSLAEKRAAEKQQRLEREAAEAAEAEAAEAKAEEGAEDGGDAPAEDKKPPVKERVKAMLDKLPALPDEEPPAEDAVEGDPPPAIVEAAAEADEGAKAAAEPEAPEAPAVEAPTPGEPETLTLTVAMAGQVLSLEKDHLMFRPSFDPGAQLKLSLAEVTSLSRYAPGKEPAAEEEPAGLEFRVVLRDGSEVPGQLMALTDKAIVVSLVGSGAKIHLPLAQVTRVERNNPDGEALSHPLLEATDRHVAALSTGEIISGQLLPSRDSDKWLRLSSPILTAEAPLSLIDLLVFPEPMQAQNDVEAMLAEALPEEPLGNNGAPAPAGDAPAEPLPLLDEPALEKEPEVHHLVSLSPAGVLWASSLRMEGGHLFVSALGNDGIAVPVERVESVSFGHETLGATAPILVWGGYADEDDEYRKTLEALGERVPARKLLKNMSKVPDADFMRQLRRSRVLLVPEMESFRKEQLEEAQGKAGRGVPTWGETFKGFLRRGGNIVFLSPTGDALTFFNDSGLGPLRSGGSGDGWKFTEAGRKLGAKIDGRVENVNATHYYRKGAPWETWGEAADGDDGVTLVGRRLERGWVMAFGADFYETNEQVTETLVRLLEFRGRR